MKFGRYKKPTKHFQCVCVGAPQFIYKMCRRHEFLCVLLSVFSFTPPIRSQHPSVWQYYTPQCTVYGEYAQNHLVSLIELTQRIQTHRQTRAYTHMHMHRLYVLLYCELYTQAREHCAEENRFQIVQIRFV